MRRYPPSVIEPYPRHRHLPRRLWLSAALALCALTLGSCADTLQDQPLGPKPLEAVMVKSRFPVYWVGMVFHGMRITSVTIDPSEAVTVRYGDCLLGGQYTCVTPISIVSSPDNSFVAGGSAARVAQPIRGARAISARGGTTLAIPTGGIIVSVYAKSRSLARQVASSVAPLNKVGLPGAPLPPALPDTGFNRVPLPSQLPTG